MEEKTKGEVLWEAFAKLGDVWSIGICAVIIAKKLKKFLDD